MISASPPPSASANSVAMRNMFARVARRYDLANHIMSLGRDFFWRDALSRRVKFLSRPGRILDLAAGTGDQIVSIKKAFPEAELVGLDLSEAMMNLAESKFERLAPPRPKMAAGDAAALPFEDESFDTVSVSFGLRNMARRADVYAETLRVLKPGGRFLVLEMYHERASVWSGPMRFYLEKVVPWLGGRLISQEPEAYKYLASSIMNFPDPKALMGEMSEAGFVGLAARTYTFKTVMLVMGEKKFN